MSLKFEPTHEVADCEDDVEEVPADAKWEKCRILHNGRLFCDVELATDMRSYHHVPRRFIRPLAAMLHPTRALRSSRKKRQTRSAVADDDVIEKKPRLDLTDEPEVEEAKPVTDEPEAEKPEVEEAKPEAEPEVEEAKPEAEPEVEEAKPESEKPEAEKPEVEEAEKPEAEKAEVEEVKPEAEKAEVEKVKPETTEPEAEKPEAEAEGEAEKPAPATEEPKILARVGDGPVPENPFFSLPSLASIGRQTAKKTYKDGDIVHTNLSYEDETNSDDLGFWHSPIIKILLLVILVQAILYNYGVFGPKEEDLREKIYMFPLSLILHIKSIAEQSLGTGSGA